jgi:hypothetical protein
MSTKLNFSTISKLIGNIIGSLTSAVVLEITNKQYCRFTAILTTSFHTHIVVRIAHAKLKHHHQLLQEDLQDSIIHYHTKVAKFYITNTTISRFSAPRSCCPAAQTWLKFP